MDVSFRPIAGYPGYRVSPHGVIESCLVRGPIPGVCSDRWHPLKPVIRSRGYPTVGLCRGGKRTTICIHHLVLEAFVGPRPSGMVGCHNDGNPSNNHITNLRWDTPAGNARDKLRHGTQPRGEDAPNAKLREHEVVAIRRLSAEGVSIRRLAARFGVTPKTIRDVVRRRTWRHLP